MPESKKIASLATLLVLTGTAMLALTDPAGAQASHFHRRATSIYGIRPAYWGSERSPATYRDIWGWRHARLLPSDSAIHQLDPNLRGDDGALAEEVGGPPPCAEPDSWGGGLVLLQGAAPFVYVPGRRWHRHFLRRGR